MSSAAIAEVTLRSCSACDGPVAKLQYERVKDTTIGTSVTLCSSILHHDGVVSNSSSTNVYPIVEVLNVY